jgi:hypothetical protein
MSQNRAWAWWMCALTILATLVLVATDCNERKKPTLGFIVPKGAELYTLENPGPMRSRMNRDTLYVLAKPDYTDETILVADGGREQESSLKAYKESLESGTQAAKDFESLPGYRRISTAFINIGKTGAIKAVEHQYRMQGKNVLGHLRSISFVVDNTLISVTCGTAVDRFETTNKEFFEPFLASMEPGGQPPTAPRPSASTP